MKSWLKGVRSMLHLVALSVTYIGAAALAATPVRVVLRQNDPAPGFADGATISNVYAARITPAGLVLVNATVASPTDDAIYLGRPGSMAVVARHSEPDLASQLPFSFTSEQKLANDSGDVVFRTRQSENYRLYGWRNGVRTLIAAHGGPTPIGGVWTDVYPPFALNPSGHVLFRGRAAGQFESGWVFAIDGALVFNDQTLYGQPVSPTNPYVWTAFTDSRGLNPVSRIVASCRFAFNLSGFDTRDGVAMISPNGASLLVSDQQPLPVLPHLTPLLFNTYSGAINAAGHCFMFTQVSGPGVSAANNFCLFFYDGQSFTLAIRSGDPALGTVPGLTWSFSGGLALNAQGDFAGMATLSGPGVTGLNDGVAFVSSQSGLRAVLREGDPAPGLPAGYTIQTIYSRCINSQGLVAILAAARATGSPARVALYAVDPDATTVRKIIADGDAVTLASSQTFTLSGLSTYSIDSGNEDGRAGWLSDSGEIVLTGNIGANRAVFLAIAADCAADVNADAVVDFLDLNTVLSAFNTTAQDAAYNAAADIDDDDDVDFADLNTVVSVFNSDC